MPELPDPRRVWRNQPTESFRMSTQQLRFKAQRRESRSRTEALTSICIGFALCLVFGWSAVRAQDPMARLGWAFLSVSTLFVARQAHKWVWPGRLPEDATPEATSNFHRRLLEKRLSYDRHIWRRSGLPFLFLGLVILLAPPIYRSPELWRRASPVVILLIVWIALFIPLQRRKKRALQREIDELRRFEDESR